MLLCYILCFFCFKASQTSPSSLVRYVILIVARLILLTLCGWVLCWTLLNLFKNHSVLNLLFLGYPWVSYQPQTSKHSSKGSGWFVLRMARNFCCVDAMCTHCHWGFCKETPPFRLCNLYSQLYFSLPYYYRVYGGLRLCFAPSGSECTCRCAASITRVELSPPRPTAASQSRTGQIRLSIAPKTSSRYCGKTWENSSLAPPTSPHTPALRLLSSSAPRSKSWRPTSTGESKKCFSTRSSALTTWPFCRCVLSRWAGVCRIVVTWPLRWACDISVNAFSFPRARSTTTCAGRASISSWCGSTPLWCWCVSCFPQVTATCCIARLRIWAAGKGWNTVPIATRRSTCKYSRCLIISFFLCLRWANFWTHV